MKTAKSIFGSRGEDIACEYLKKNGYLLVARNVREKWGELDIVVRAKDKTLVCVEVKTMHDGDLMPEDQMTGHKMEKFRRTASLYINSHKELVHEKSGFRLDVVAITFRGDEYSIRHYENVI